VISYERFILDFFVLEKPFYNLLKKDVPFHFIRSEKEVEFKNKLASKPILTVYSSNFNCIAILARMILAQYWFRNRLLSFFDRFSILASELLKS